MLFRIILASTSPPQTKTTASFPTLKINHISHLDFFLGKNISFLNFWVGLKNHLFASQHLTGNVGWPWFSPQAKVRQLTAWMDFQWQKNSGVRWFFEFINLESGSNTYELPSPPPNVPLKGTMLKGIWSSNHRLSRDILVFRGVAIRQLFECKLLKKLLLCITCLYLYVLFVICYFSE